VASGKSRFLIDELLVEHHTRKTAPTICGSSEGTNGGKKNFLAHHSRKPKIRLDSVKL
jgi:hypothetical protein